MKKRIFALLLAGLITLSAASCVSSKKRPDGGTEGSQTRQPTVTTAPPAATVTWQDVNETVYVTASKFSLIGVENSQTVSVNQMTKLKRVKIGSNSKSIVELDGVQYYADTKSLNNTDLLGETFTACTPTTMYITEDGVAVRKYASKDSSFSPSITTKNINDTVTVVAKGESWYKIQYDENNQYFVNATYVAANEVIDYNDITKYPTFTDLPAGERFQLYVVANSLTLRKCPSTKANAESYLKQGAELTVVAQQNVTDEDGETTLWYKVFFTVEGSAGQGSTNIVGYVAQSKYVSTDRGDSTSVTLDDMLEDYPEFTATEEAQTMYVSADSLNVRYSPELPAKDANGKEINSNLVYDAGLVKKDEVKVVATGTKNDMFWAMIEYDEGKFYFVSYKYLTPDAEGNPAPMTLEQLLATYQNFEELETTKTVYAKTTVNCNTVPKYEEEVSRQLSANEAVTVVAQGEVNYQTWYLCKTADGLYFFAGADLFTDSTAAS